MTTERAEPRPLWDVLDEAEHAVFGIVHPFDHPRVHRVFQDLRLSLDAACAVRGEPEPTPPPPLEAREAVGKERARILAAVNRLRRQVVRSPEEGGDSVDAELGSLLNEVFLIVDNACQPEPPREAGLDVESLTRAMERAMAAVDDEWTIPEFAEITAAEYTRLAEPSATPSPDAGEEKAR